MENIEELEKLCKKITKLDPKMRSARFINSRGHLMAGGMKEGLLSLEAQKQDEMMFMELALRVRMRHEFDKEFGMVHFSMSYRDKVIVMSFPLSNDDVLLVSCEKDINFGKIPFKILKLIEPLKNAPMKTF
ncbi:hypothetical protein AAA799E16_01369 [Marine Group I thaumarchaeote SCGC AAA799-E16]|uniref:Roadblock/LAMTOR2 domain-containing protein n=6 Tax=Marine Group I TaxID=905826 RepID=A0A087S7D2_9ARCH|nr:hypothetical protein AAA799N04_00260 [Marine Group I thaumarchaeote SCGC AAA799-N04]KER05924.1 hypothetical protein AAA799E16_01369 [Marine Group I thaumarchaeote SCGC AAA799-E16]KFM16027.1 hypothetical protein AAA799D11_00816 [Marine Group I thaumarchaeote SCGC AAA799-D11]KFM17764.1 hypothetical protein SCCGRSA3_01694 [Marine Group I thaumarchaeote SCGC RSA3]KFM18891.1 hypothetical protein AAA799P11_00922 [Marine Group I thaumarchaeote SCGC AAA799-P11]KFM21636.1 hypothetical protein AAA799